MSSQVCKWIWTFGDDTVSGHENHLDYSSFVCGKDVEDLPWLLFHWPILYVQYLGRIVLVSVLLSGDLALEFSKHPCATFPQLINSEITYQNWNMWKIVPVLDNTTAFFLFITIKYYNMADKNPWASFINMCV